MSLRVGSDGMAEGAQSKATKANIAHSTSNVQRRTSTPNVRERAALPSMLDVGCSTLDVQNANKKTPTAQPRDVSATDVNKVGPAPCDCESTWGTFPRVPQPLERAR